jgi:hypothetical protein
VIESRLEGIFKWHVDDIRNKTLNKYAIHHTIDNNEYESEFYIGKIQRFIKFNNSINTYLYLF